MKILLIFLFSINVMFAFELTRKYDANVGLYGNVGQALLSEKHNKKSYSMRLTLKPTSLISDLSGIDSIEYLSVGTIDPQGVFTPESFISTILSDNKREKTTYLYKHSNKYILKKTHVEEEIKNAEIEALIFDEKKRKQTKITDKTKKIKYVSNDYLTLIKNAHSFKEGPIEYLDQNSTSSLYLLSAETNRFKIKIKTKESKYLLELQNDMYGLTKAKTLKSLEIGDADLKTIKMKVSFK